MFSIVIPIHEEEEIIRSVLERLDDLKGDFEVIVAVSEKSRDASFDIASSFESSYPLKVIKSSIGTRSDNMNSAAKEARGEWLIFLHSDIELPRDALMVLEKAIQNKKYVAGAYKITFDTKKHIYKGIALFSNTRARIFGMYHGDQCIFVRRDVFEGMRGYREIPLMEDVAFSLDIKKYGKTLQLESRVMASPRKIEANGVLKMTFIYIYLKSLFYLGFDINYIARTYRGLKSK